MTLDHCCILELKRNGPHASALREVLAHCEAQHITPAVYGHGGLENPRRGTTRQNDDFDRLLAEAGLSHADRLPPSANPPIIKWVHSVVFPDIPYWLDDYVREQGKAAG